MKFSFGPHFIGGPGLSFCVAVRVSAQLARLFARIATRRGFYYTLRLAWARTWGGLQP